MIEVRCPCCNQLFFRLGDMARTEFHIEMKCPRANGTRERRLHSAEGIFELIARQNEGFSVEEIIE